MKFNELTIRELKAQATSACIKAVRLLEKSQLSIFDFLTVDFITPMTTDEDDDSEYFTALGSIWLDDAYVSKVPFKAYLVWLGDGCDLAAAVEDSVEFIDVDIDYLTATR